MKFSTALTLGRVSNLPTVWSNVLAGMALTGVYANNHFPSLAFLLCILAAFSLLYLGGMFFNDAFDAQWDKNHQQNRPIVNGETSVKEVSIFATVFFILALALFGLTSPDEKRLILLGAALLLIGCILLYDWKHKDWAFSAWIMGACRLMVYITAALSISSLNNNVLAAGICLMAYIAGITTLARREHLNDVASFLPLVLLAAPIIFAIILSITTTANTGYSLWPAILTITVTSAWLLYGIRFLLPGTQRFIPRAIGALLAGLCLIDASLLFALGQYARGAIALLCFAVCLLMQRKIKAS